MEKVSILIPCHNAERWIRQAIASALNQTYKNKEVVVVDDGSTDSSLDIIKSFGNAIRWESGKNLGGNFARNRLLELSIGGWLQFLDADDYLLPRKIENQFIALSKTTGKVDAIYSPVTVEEWSGTELINTYATHIDVTQTIEEQWIRWKVAQTGAMLWSRKRLCSIGGWNTDYQCCQDNELAMRAILRGFRLVYSPSADAVYRIWSRDTVSRRSPHRIIAVRSTLIGTFRNQLVSANRWNASLQKAVNEVVFEHARTLATYRISDGSRYLQEQSLGRASVNAVPLSYRALYKIAGFRVAEIVAYLMRGSKCLN